MPNARASAGTSETVLVDGMPAAQVASDDRGLLYGDGLFETVLFVDGAAPLWPRHLQRLTLGCARLRLPPPDVAELARESVLVAAGHARAVVRITLTRGSGPRGYAPPIAPQPRRIVAAHAAPAPRLDCFRAGIRVGFCATLLASQPLLAGLKHLNRLEQVLARAEWDDPAIAEGLMFDSADHPVCATAANLFAVVDGVLRTPALDHCGVAGVARAEVLARCDGAVVAPLTRGELMRADEVFLSSSVRGIVPVAQTPDRSYGVGATTRALQAAWFDLGLSPRVAG